MASRVNGRVRKCCKRQNLTGIYEGGTRQKKLALVQEHSADTGLPHLSCQVAITFCYVESRSEARKYTYTYSNKRRGTYLIFRVSGAALIRGRRIFKRLIPQRQNILIVQFNLLHEYFSWLTGLNQTS